MKQKLIAIVGPTATGKSNLAVLLAKELNGEVISADSAQVYKGLDIGSAKITPAEMQDIPHHLLDIVGPETDYNIGLFQKDAENAIRSIVNKGKIPILCGGSGLYINSVINIGYDLSETPDANKQQRNVWMQMEETEGKGTLYNLLKKKFPNRAEKIHENDYQRILRALEMNDDIDPKRSNQWESPYDLSIYGLTMNRELLYQRIEKRIDIMFSDGLVDEVRSLINLGYQRGGNALSALGYKEIIPYIDGLASLKDVSDELKKATRHFAKRQLTWFRRDPRIQWYDVFDDGGIELIAQKIIMLEKNPIA